MCTACEHWCSRAPGETGKCGVRRNDEGHLMLLVYGRATALAADPMEKKPLFHFLPGEQILSLGTVGCCFTCVFCQNWHTSQWKVDVEEPGFDLSPEEIVERCLRTRIRAVAFTYNEPAVFFEYAYDTARLAHENGIRTVFVSSGFETEEALETIEPYLDAVNVDLKAFSDRTYREMIGARLKPVLRNIGSLAASRAWLEVATLVVPQMNDSDAELRDMAEFLVSVSPDIPWHLSAFHPDYGLLDRPPTPGETLVRAREIGLEAGLRFVYLGNVSGGQDTTCPSCGEMLVEREWYWIRERWPEPGECPSCGAAIPGVWA